MSVNVGIAADWTAMVRILARVFVAAVTFLLDRCLPALKGRAFRLRLKWGIYEARRWDRPRCHDVQSRFHKDWLSHSEADGRIAISKHELHRSKETYLGRRNNDSREALQLGPELLWWRKAIVLYSALEKCIYLLVYRFAVLTALPELPFDDSSATPLITWPCVQWCVVHWWRESYSVE